MPEASRSDGPIAFAQEQQLDKSLIALFGAILLSAVGSLPLHLIPLILVTLIADGRVSLAEAGWIASAILLGQLLSSLTLPTLKITVVRRMPAFGAALLLLAGLAMTTTTGPIGLYLGWFVVGCSAGVLMFLGTVSAAHYRNTTFAFSMRLSVVLCLAGSMIAGLLISQALGSYSALLTMLLLIFSLLLTLGLLLYDPVTRVAKPIDEGRARRWHTPQILGLIALFILFIGQTGFLAYVAQGAIDRGMTIAESIWAIVAMKIVAGIWLAGNAIHGAANGRRHRLLEFGILLAISLCVASQTTMPLILLLSLLTFEIAFNTLSARFQAALANANRHVAGQWLTATLLMGAAFGPPLYGAAIGANLGFYFILFALCSAIIPAIWAKVCED
ncbi:MAG: hypothetical protein ACR2QF_11060 [Geminicoccaceae bacterium]